MKYGIRFFEEASREIEHERSWYRERSITAEQSFLRELDHAIEVVTDAPGLWPRYIAGTRRYVFPTFPFSLVYFVEGETIIVAALESEHRRPGYWRSRMHDPAD